MKPACPLRVAAALAAIAVGVGVAGPAAASAPPTTPPTTPATIPATTVALPAGYQRLVDETGVITIAVPAAWTDIDTAPAMVDGIPEPWIAAAPTSIDRFLGTFEESGVLFSAVPFDPDTAFLVEQFSITQGCAEFRVVPYDARGFVGMSQIGSACGEDGTGSWQLILANPADESFTALVQVQAATVADAAAAQIALDTFATVDAGGAAPSSSVAP